MSSVFDNSTRRYNFSGSQYAAVGAASARLGPFDSEEILVHPSTRTHINVGGSGVVAANGTGNMPIEAGEKFHLRITSGQYVAFIQDSAVGVIAVVPTAL
jgi:hypothetical protein